jgi:transposase
LRPELLALAKANKPEPQYITDDIAKEKGHIILRLPPYHADLNPIELVLNTT